MRARVQVYSKDGKTFLGTMPVKGLQFSEEIGGGGSCTFDVTYSNYDAIEAWDSVIKIQLERAPGVWINGPAYVSRHQYRDHRGGKQWFSIQCRGLLEAWASETILLPEYVVNTMTRKARQERGIGWMSSLYDAANDPYEAWNSIQYDNDHPDKPEGWPSGSGAEWMTASGSNQTSECKYFRSKLTITGTASRLVKFWLSSDESATLWVAGERVIETSSVETGYETCEHATMRMFPGTYVVGIRTDTIYSKGGSGTDPVIACGAILGSNGQISQWIMKTDNNTWIATRRDDVPPNDVPPGPNPGVVIRGLIGEAKERKASGWPNVTYGFTTTYDSYGTSWAKADVTEQIHRYGQTTYWDLFQQWGESGEVDVWMGADYVLHASLTQGRHRNIEFGTTHFNEFFTSGTEGNGNWVIGEGHGGWIYAGTKTPRREYALEVGTAYSRPALTKIAKASLKDSWRWDAHGTMNPPQAGWIPYYDFGMGDDMSVHYKGVIHNLSVTSLSAVAGEGGLIWDVEFTEYPPEGEPPPVGGIPLLAWAKNDEPAPEPPPPVSTDPGLFYDLENYVPAPPTSET